MSVGVDGDCRRRGGTGRSMEESWDGAKVRWNIKGEKIFEKCCRERTVAVTTYHCDIA